MYVCVWQYRISLDYYATVLVLIMFTCKSHRVYANESIFSHACDMPLNGLVGRGDSTYYREWWLARSLYPRMQLRNVWEVPATGNAGDEDTGVVVAQDPSADEVGYISDMEFSQDGRYLVASSTGNALYIFDPNTGRLRHSIKKPHGDAVSKVRFVNNLQFVSGSADCTLALWDVRKPTAPVNVLRAHGRPIRSIDYDSNSGMLISAAQDGQFRYWHLPSFQTPGTGDQETDTPGLRGVLLACPNLSQACFSLNKGMAVWINTHGTIFVVDNLDVGHLRYDLRSLRFDESIKMQLCWFTPNASVNRRNRIRVIEAEDYSPALGATVSNVAHSSFHPILPAVLLRLTTSMKVGFRQDIRVWTCISNLQQHCLGNDAFGGSSFGTNVMEETLLFSTAETKYSSFREKKPCFTSCGRLIASPDKYGIRLLSFSSGLDTCGTAYKRNCVSSGSTALGFWPSGPANLVAIRKIERGTNSTICCKFSPNDMLLAVGDSDCNVSFYQPSL